MELNKFTGWDTLFNLHYKSPAEIKIFGLFITIKKAESTVLKDLKIKDDDNQIHTLKSGTIIRKLKIYPITGFAEFYFLQNEKASKIRMTDVCFLVYE